MEIKNNATAGDQSRSSSVNRPGKNVFRMKSSTFKMLPDKPGTSEAVRSGGTQKNLISHLNDNGPGQSRNSPMIDLGRDTSSPMSVSNETSVMRDLHIKKGRNVILLRKTTIDKNGMINLKGISSKDVRPDKSKRSPPGSPIEYHSDDLDRELPEAFTPAFIIKDSPDMPKNLKDGKKSSSIMFSGNAHSEQY